MAWRIEFAPSAKRELDKLERQAAVRILSFLNNRLLQADNPRVLGAALSGSRLGDFWKYRVGDYRIIAAIEDEVMTVLVVKIGNRREVYKR